MLEKTPADREAISKAVRTILEKVEDEALDPTSPIWTLDLISGHTAKGLVCGVTKRHLLIDVTTAVCDILAHDGYGCFWLREDPGEEDDVYITIILELRWKGINT